VPYYLPPLTLQAQELQDSLVEADGKQRPTNANSDASGKNVATKNRTSGERPK